MSIYQVNINRLLTIIGWRSIFQFVGIRLRHVYFHSVE